MNGEPPATGAETFSLPRRRDVVSRLSPAADALWVKALGKLRELAWRIDQLRVSPIEHEILGAVMERITRTLDDVRLDVSEARDFTMREWPR